MAYQAKSSRLQVWRLSWVTRTCQQYLLRHLLSSRPLRQKLCRHQTSQLTKYHFQLFLSQQRVFNLIDREHLFCCKFAIQVWQDLLVAPCLCTISSLGKPMMPQSREAHLRSLDRRKLPQATVWPNLELEWSWKKWFLQKCNLWSLPFQFSSTLVNWLVKHHLSLVKLSRKFDAAFSIL